MMTETPDDLTQTYMVAKNEVIKFLRSRKFMLYGLLVVAIVALMTLLPYALGDGLSGSGGDIFSGYIGYASLLVLLGATLFASYSIVSEFEERTALILFTRPLRKFTIFLGKFAACFALTGVVMVLYYAVSLVIAFAVSGELVTSFAPSLVMCLLYVFATTGVAMLISSVMKKGGTSAVMTFVTILLLISVVSAVMSASGIDTWFMLDSAASSITNSIPEYVASSNDLLVQVGQELGVDMSGSMIEPADCVASGGAMAAWGLITLVLAYLRFSRREF